MKRHKTSTDLMGIMLDLPPMLAAPAWETMGNHGETHNPHGVFGPWLRVAQRLGWQIEWHRHSLRLRGGKELPGLLRLEPERELPLPDAVPRREG